MENHCPPYIDPGGLGEVDNEWSVIVNPNSDIAQVDLPDQAREGIQQCLPYCSSGAIVS
jgi:hypothetical protein